MSGLESNKMSDLHPLNETQLQMGENNNQMT